MTENEFAHIGKPIQIGPTHVRNRIVDPAKTLFYSTDYTLSDRHLDFYRERARGGAGLIITEQQAAHPMGKGSFFRSCTAYETRAIPRFEQLANAQPVGGRAARQERHLLGGSRQGIPGRLDVPDPQGR